MSSPFFSVIIPTRNRYDTLQYAIRTVLFQDFDSFELIISDNSDAANLVSKVAIEKYLNDPRVKYHRPPSVISMSDNWEFAVSKATGEFLIIFGDDDGLVAGALKNIRNIIEQTTANLISWARVEYSWPDRTPQELSNLMIIPYKAPTGLINAERYTKKVLCRQGDYRYLPMFYNSAVNKQLVQQLREKAGRVFHSACPDIYTGFAFAHLLKEYISVGHPFSINGVSAKSNGAAHLNEDKAIKADYWRTFKTSEIKWPSSIPEIPTVYLAILEPFIQLTRFFPELNSYISRRGIFKNIVDRLESTDEQDLKEKLEKILEHTSNEQSLYKWLANYIQKTAPKISANHLPAQQAKLGFDGSHLALDASNFGLANVYDVSIFISNLFGNPKPQDYLKPAYPSLLGRIRKATGVVLRGV